VNDILQSFNPSDDSLLIGGVNLLSRLFVGTGKFSSHEIVPRVLEASGSQVVTMALRRVDWKNPQENILNYLPQNTLLLPNTSGARTAEEAVRIARLAQAAGCGNWIKIEVVQDQHYLLPDNWETLRATEQLVKEGFVVLPYMSPDLSAARRSDRKQQRLADQRTHPDSNRRYFPTDHCRCWHRSTLRGGRSYGNGSGRSACEYGYCHGRRSGVYGPGLPLSRNCRTTWLFSWAG